MIGADSKEIDRLTTIALAKRDVYCRACYSEWLWLFTQL